MRKVANRLMLPVITTFLLLALLLPNSSLSLQSTSALIRSSGSISYAPTPAPNLAVIPDDWGGYATSGYLHYNGGPQIIFLDTTFTHNGHPTIRMERHVPGVDVNTCRECDGTWYPVKPGDHIIAKCWIYVGDSGVGDTISWHGGRLGMDLYAHTSAGYKPVDSYPHSGTSEHPASVVMWGTKTWTQKSWDIIIPSTYYTITTPAGGSIKIDPIQIDSIVLWLDVREVDDPGLAWFADAELYINP